MTKLEKIKVQITRAERKAKELREAIRELERIRAKCTRTQRDMDIYDEMVLRLQQYDLDVPDEWRHLCW